MKLSRFGPVALAAVMAASLAFAQTQPIPGAKTASGQPAPVTGAAIVMAPAGGGAGLATVVAVDNPLVVNCVTGCSGGGGGGDATAANQTAVIGSKAAGTAAASALLTGSVYNSTPPTLTNGQQAALQADTSGRVITNVGVSALPTGAATAVKQPALGTAGAASTDVISVQGISGGVAQPVSAASLPLPSGAATSALQGAQGTGSTYNPPTGGSGEIGYLSGIYAAAIDTTAVAVTVSTALPAGTNNIGDIDVLTLPALPAGSALIGGVKLIDTGGTTAAAVKAASTAPATTDPALVVAQSPFPSLTCSNVIPISLTASTDLVTFTNTGYVCSIVLVGAAAETWGLVDGTGTVCATGIAGRLGGTTGTMSFSANGGFSAVSDRAWLKMSGTAKHLCLIKSGSGNISGVITTTDN